MAANTLDYAQFYELFVENGAETLRMAKLLTKSELEEIGMDNIGQWLKIMEGVQSLKKV